MTQNSGLANVLLKILDRRMCYSVFWISKCNERQEISFGWNSKLANEMI